MNQKQKALAEKAIKIRYNSLINSLKTIQTKIEADNPDLNTITSPIYCDTSYLSGGDAQLRLMNGDIHEHLRKQAAEIPPEIYRLVDDAEKARAAYSKACHKLQEVIRVKNKEIQEENLRRRELRREAENSRAAFAAKLAGERDTTILDIHFKDECDELVQLLDNLPTPAATMEILEAAGISLTSALPEATGIGDRNPEHLHEN